uniref:ANKLE2 third alpha/beta domain-containing protein n=1 Tax=Timema genevievae TaxID=629358 RepID=A0A7R9PKP2_TIMGE|nr:unnamed protein product [Timema genevievae]
MALGTSSRSLCGSNEFLHVYTDKLEVLKVMKLYKKSRFKPFKSKKDAEYFTLHGSDVQMPPMSTIVDSPTAVTLSGEKPSLFKGPKPQEMVRFRKSIECGDEQTVRSAVWENPRYFVSSGDTPAILQEGSRYNALHIASKARNAKMCVAILSIVGDPKFVAHLYGEDDPNNCRDRAEILLDLYLNTPDKGLNETPLHFAVKFGAVDVVEALVSYPQCDKELRNKYGQIPKDIICSRADKANSSVKHEIYSLLGDRFYVPVLRSEDNSIQPTVGDVFSPKCPPAINSNPLLPHMEIKAYAGPMDREQAVVFRKKLKTPPRSLRNNGTPGSPMHQFTNSPSSAFRLQDAEKGLERVGRSLAQEFKVQWKEFWPFLNTFVDLSSQDGLQRLEEYLRIKFTLAGRKSVTNDSQESQTSINNTSKNTSDNNFVSPITDLCLAFKACTLIDCGNVRPITNGKRVLSFPKSDEAVPENESYYSPLTNAQLDPFVYIEKSCQVYAKRIFDGLVRVSVIGRLQSRENPVLEMLKPEMNHFQSLVSSYLLDSKFENFDFHLTHSRISAIVATKLCDLPMDDKEFIVLSLENILNLAKEVSFSDEEDVMNINERTYRKQKCTNVTKVNDNINQVKCISKHILSALERSKENRSRIEHVDSLQECMQAWSLAEKCSCSWHTSNFLRNSRKSSSLKRNQAKKFNMNKNVMSVERKSEGLKLVSGSHDVSRYEQDCSEAGDTEPLNCEHANNISDTKLSSLDWPQHLAQLLTLCGLGVRVDFETVSPKHLWGNNENEEFFLTPPSSPTELNKRLMDDFSSDEEMFTPEEGVDVFIEGEQPSKMDILVLQALEECPLTPQEFPHVFRWRHAVLLHSEQERNMWLTPKANQTRRRLMSSPHQSSPYGNFTPPKHSSSPLSSPPARVLQFTDCDVPVWSNWQPMGQMQPAATEYPGGKLEGNPQWQM